MAIFQRPLVVVFAWWLATTGAARGQDSSSPDNSERPPPGAGKRELNFFPIVGGDSDVGFGGGELSNWARLGTTEGSFIWKVKLFGNFEARTDVWSFSI